MKSKLLARQAGRVVLILGILGTAVYAPAAEVARWNRFGLDGGGGQARSAAYQADFSIRGDGGTAAAVGVRAHSGYLGQLNEPPVPGTDTVSRGAGSAFRYPLAELLANDQDPEGDPLAIPAVAATSARGGAVSLDGDTLVYVPPALDGGFGDTLTVWVSDGDEVWAAATVVVTGPLASSVVGRHVFYNQSPFDGNSAEAGPADDGAIASDKTALLPGAKAGFSNYTSYPRGLNGLMIDIQGVPGNPTAADFGFRAGNTADPGAWFAAPRPGSVTLRRGAGAGGSDRLTLLWGADAVKKQWLQVTVLASAATGLAQPEVFYFGNAIGETGNSATDARVTSIDALRVLGNVGTSVPVSHPYDINRDGGVDGADRLLVLNHLSALEPLLLLDLSGGGALHAAVSGPGTDPRWTDRRAAELAAGSSKAGDESVATGGARAVADPVGVRLRVRTSADRRVQVTSDGPLPPGTWMESSRSGAGGPWERIEASPAVSGAGAQHWDLVLTPGRESALFRLAFPAILESGQPPEDEAR